MPRYELGRTKFVFILKNGRTYKTQKPKGPPPPNVSIYKGSTHIIAIRRICSSWSNRKRLLWILKRYSNTGWNDIFILQRHPWVPGGINGNQPTWIPRALYWISKENSGICRGKWVRMLCWITFQDLRWVLGEEKKDKLFVHKVPFEFNEELIECILVATQGRK